MKVPNAILDPPLPSRDFCIGLRVRGSRVKCFRRAPRLVDAPRKPDRARVVEDRVPCVRGRYSVLILTPKFRKKGRRGVLTGLEELGPDDREVGREVAAEAEHAAHAVPVRATTSRTSERASE